MSKTPPDWDAIEREFRAGSLSVREIARQHGITDTAIRKHAKQHGWERDLEEQVRAKASAKLVRSISLQTQRANETAKRRSDPQRDEEIVEGAATRQVEVVRQHMASLGRAARVVDKLLGELEDGTDNAVDIVEAIEVFTRDDKSPKRRDAMLKAVSLGSRATTARDLSAALKNMIPLERQAFKIDEAPEKPKDEAAGMSKLEVARRLAFLMTAGAKEMGD